MLEYILNHRKTVQVLVLTETPNVLYLPFPLPYGRKKPSAK